MIGPVRKRGKWREAERALEECQAKWDEINMSISVEAVNFHRATNADFASALHIHQQLAFEEQQQRHWSCLPSSRRCRPHGRGAGWAQLRPHLGQTASSPCPLGFLSTGWRDREICGGAHLMIVPIGVRRFLTFVSAF